MRKLFAFNDIVERTMRSRYQYLRKDQPLKDFIFKILDIFTFTPNIQKLTHDPGYNPFFLHFSDNKFIETHKLVGYFAPTDLSPMEAMLKLTVGDQTNKYRLRNTLSLILYEIVLFSGVSGENLFNTHLFQAYEIMEKEFFKQYSDINDKNLIDFHQNSIKPFSDVFQKAVAAATSDNLKDFPLFCSKTHRHRYKEHEDIFRNDILPSLIQKNHQTKTIHIISLGCSRADDLYDLYEVLFEYKDRLKDWKIILEGRDINSASLQKARDLFSKSQWIDFRLIETNLADPDSIEQLIGHNYDLLIFRKAAMYLDQEIQDIYSRNLKASYIFATSDFIPDNRYQMLNDDKSEPVYQLYNNEH
jgi:chemotaxis methyl-accepting protein methylase